MVWKIGFFKSKRSIFRSISIETNSPRIWQADRDRDEENFGMCFEILGCVWSVKSMDERDFVLRLILVVGGVLVGGAGVG